MVTLAADATAEQERFRVSGMPDPEIEYVQLDSEIVRIIVQRPQASELLVERSYAGTTADSHSSETELTPVYVPSVGGGEPQTVLTGADAEAGQGGSVSVEGASDQAAGVATVSGGVGAEGFTGGMARIQGGSGDGGSTQAAFGNFEGGDIGAEGRIELYGAEIRFSSPVIGFNKGPVAIPEVPASPTEQDIVDALVALGLVTQA